jgi:hypothetical protein
MATAKLKRKPRLSKMEYPSNTESLERASCLRRKRDYAAPHQATEQSKRATSLPTGNRAPSGAVIFSRVSVFERKGVVIRFQ